MRVLVTGAASGIGRATCLRLARDAGAQGRKAQSGGRYRAVGHDLVVDGGIAGNFLGRLPGISQITRG